VIICHIQLFTKVYRGLTMKNFKSLAIIITSASMFSCAIPQAVYKTTEGAPLHPEFPTYTSLDCTELSAQRNKMKELLVEVAEGAIEESDRSTYSLALGLGTNNPKTGKNFIGFQSEGVDPQVNELRLLKFELEKLEDVQIDKCVTRQGFFDIKQ